MAILDADRPGYLRSQTSLIQTIGRAARNVDGRVILYADDETPAMAGAMAETARRREKQKAYNAAHGITPASVTKALGNVLTQALQKGKKKGARSGLALPPDAAREKIATLRKQMLTAAENLEFETAARIRDEIAALEGR